MQVLFGLCATPDKKVNPFQTPTFTNTSSGANWATARFIMAPTAKVDMRGNLANFFQAILLNRHPVLAKQYSVHPAKYLL